MHIAKIFLYVLIFSFLLTPSDAEAKKRRRKKEKSNPDIKCTLDSRLQEEREVVEVRLAKLVRNKGGKIQTVKISPEVGDSLCKSFSQVLWKKLVEGKAERNCSEPLKILVRGKRHNICLEESEKADLQVALADVEKALTATETP